MSLGFIFGFGGTLSWGGGGHVTTSPSPHPGGMVSIQNRRRNPADQTVYLCGLIDTIFTPLCLCWTVSLNAESLNAYLAALTLQFLTVNPIIYLCQAKHIQPGGWDRERCSPNLNAELKKHISFATLTLQFLTFNPIIYLCRLNIYCSGGAGQRALQA